MRSSACWPRFVCQEREFHSLLPQTRRLEGYLERLSLYISGIVLKKKIDPSVKKSLESNSFQDDRIMQPKGNSDASKAEIKGVIAAHLLPQMFAV